MKHVVRIQEFMVHAYRTDAVYDIYAFRLDQECHMRAYTTDVVYEMYAFRLDQEVSFAATLSLQWVVCLRFTQTTAVSLQFVCLVLLICNACFAAPREETSSSFVLYSTTIVFLKMLPLDGVHHRVCREISGQLQHFAFVKSII